MRPLFIILVVALVGCTTRPTASAAYQVRGKLIFTITPCVSHQGDPREKNGHFFCIEERVPDSASPCVTGYEIRKGVLADVVGGGTDGSEKLLGRLRAIGFAPFDFYSEVREINLRESQADAQGERFVPPMVVDGGCYEITYDFDGVHFQIQGYEPGYDIDFYAQYSPKIAKLKAVLDLFSEYYGRGMLRI